MSTEGASARDAEGTAMADQLVEVGQPTALRSKLTCRLRKKTTGRAAGSPTAGEVELENTSGEVLEIVSHFSPFQYLDIVVRDASGRVLSEGHYGDIFSPMENAYVWRLQPGEKLLHPVSLTAAVPQEKIAPGEYTVQAVYEHNGLRAVSEPFRFQIAGEGP